MLALLIAILAVGGLAAWYGERAGPDAPRWIALAAISLVGLLLLPYFGPAVSPTDGAWLSEIYATWIPRFGVGFHLALDGLSLALAVLTVLLGAAAVAASWTEIRDRVGFFHCNLLWTLAGVLGVFLAMDLFLFFVFWEAMVVPMALLIAIWGHEDRTVAAMKFFLFTQLSGLLMLLAMIGLVLLHHQNTGIFTFDYPALLNAELDGDVARWLMLGFFVAFAVKLPAVPFHTWLPDAHTQAPTGGSVLLAGVLLKTGAYGLLRFVLPLFPEAAAAFAPVAQGLGVASILYGGWLAFGQDDMKRLIAYTSISHMGFVLVGVFAWNEQGIDGAVMTMLAHGISASALFMLAGGLQERIHTRDMRRMGRLWADVPRMGAIALFFSVAALGLPGLGNFVGEFLVLQGGYLVSPVITAIAAMGLVVAPVYSLILMQRVFQGTCLEPHRLSDCGGRELAAFGVLMLATLWLGLYPLPALTVAKWAMAPVMELSYSGEDPPP
ncbi:complex I subunit 4 family protein [Methylolobus aquaticus]